MSENKGCLDKKCSECSMHGEQGGKIVCNKNNRLGLKSELSNMLFGEDKN